MLSQRPLARKRNPEPLMRLTQHVDYSLRVLMYLAVRPDGFGTIKQISEAYGISRNHLMKVVQALGRKGYVETTRGKGGGLALKDAPDQIIIGRVVRDMEADLALVECLGTSNRCAITPECRLQQLLVDALDAFLDVLDRRTLADLTAAPEPLVQLLSVRRNT